MKQNNNEPIKVTMSFKSNGYKKVIVGVSNKKEYKQILKHMNYSKKIKIPDFGILQTDNNYIYRTDYWKINKEKYWSKALKIIPSGNLLYSKRPEMFLPNKWPTYFKNLKIVMFGIKNKNI